MRTNAKAVLRALKNLKGEYPIAVRITIDRKQKFLAIKERALPEQWNNEMGLLNKKHPYATPINDRITTLIKNINDYAYTLDCPIRDAAEIIIKHFNSNKIEPSDKSNFFRYALLFMERYRNDISMTTYNVYDASLKVIEKFLGRNTLTWVDINRELTNDFHRYLISEKYSAGTQKKIFTHFKNIYNRAAIELSGVYRFVDTPFAGITFEKSTTSKVRLNETEIKMIRKVTDPRVALAKDVFLFGWNLGGMRISDLCTLKWSQISPDGFLTYQMRKTRKTSQVRRLELSFEAKDIVAKYRTGGEYVFPLLKDGDTREMFMRIRHATTQINRKLALLSEIADLRKKITTHVTRHSWTSIALGKGADVRDVQSVLGHSDLSTTQHYIASMENSQISKTNLRIVQ